MSVYTHIGSDKPEATSVIQDGQRDKYHYCRHRNQYDRPIDVETVARKTTEVQPHDQPEKKAQQAGYLHR